MTTKYYILIMLFLTTSLTFSQDYLNETFDTATFPPTGWEVNKVEGDESWKHSDTKKEAFADSNRSKKQDAWLITPQLNITANAVLRFKTKTDELVPPDNLYIKVSETGKAVADFNKTLKAIKVGENVTKNYQTYIIDLKNYKGKSIYIGFQHKTETVGTDNGASGFYLDDVVVTSTLQKDVAVLSLLSPHQGDLVGSKKVRILIKNTGDIDIEANKIKVSYKYNGVTTNEVVSNALKIGETLDYEFSAPVNVAVGSGPFATTAIVDGDANNSNSGRGNFLKFNSDKSLEENFSGSVFLPSGWTSYYISGPYADKLRKKDETAFIKSTAYAMGNDMLITPKTKIESGYILKFNMNAPDYLQFYADNPSMIAKDELKIKISETDNGKTDFTTTIKTIDLKTHYKKGKYDDNTFKDFSIDLSAYAGKEVYIAFDYTNSDGFGIGINKVEVGKQTALSVEKVSTNPLVQIYPNPTTNFIRINNVENAVVSLFNTSGKQLLSQKISAEDNSIRTEHLASGIYLLKIDEGSAIATRKIIKR